MNYDTIKTNAVLELNGFKLKNPRWSWGSYKGKEVILRVWHEEVLTEDGNQFVMIHDKEDTGSRAGANERKQHFEAILSGCTPYFLLMNRAPDEVDWKIGEIDRCLSVGKQGAFTAAIRRDNKWYVQLTGETISFEDFDNR